MGRIKGLNDKATLIDKVPKAAITVWKGAKKSPKAAGKSLESNFRIEAPAYLRDALARAYKTEVKDGSIFVSYINLVPAFEDEQKTFDSFMAAFSASRPILFCDREKVHTRFVEKRSPAGGIYFDQIRANENCPVAGTNFDCQNGCNRVGNFYFYIYELLLLGYADFARLQVHGVKDNQHIADFLDSTKLQIGSIKISPFVSEETRQYIIFKLTRRKVASKFPVMEAGKRTAKRGTKDDWICNLTLNEIWQRRYDYHQQAQNLIAANYQPSMRLIEQVHGEGLILQPERNKVAALPSPDSAKLKAYKERLAEAYKNNNWLKEGWAAMMMDAFGTTNVSENLDLNLLMAIAESGEQRDEWCEF